MGSRMFLLLGLVLLIFTDHSQGVPETHEQPSTVDTFTDGSSVGEPLTNAKPINTPRQHNRMCICKGKMREMGMTHCPCQPSARRNGRRGYLKRWCQRKENKNLKKCRRFSKPEKGNKFGPSVPI